MAFNSNPGNTTGDTLTIDNTHPRPPGTQLDFMDTVKSSMQLTPGAQTVATPSGTSAYEEIINITGSGSISLLTAEMSLGHVTRTSKVRITIDGVAFETDAIVCASANNGFNVIGYFEYNVMCSFDTVYFKESLKIETWWDIASGVFNLYHRIQY